MCGVFGIFGHEEAANLTYLGLHAQQHRGQEAAGLTASDGSVMREHKGQGLGVWLVESLLTHPDLQGLRTFILGTHDAHSLYQRFGFAVPPIEGRWLVRSVAPAELYADEA